MLARMYLGLVQIPAERQNDIRPAFFSISQLDAESMARANAVKTVRLKGRLELPDSLPLGLDVDRITQINSLLP